MPPIERPVTLIGGLAILFVFWLALKLLDRPLDRAEERIGEQRPGDIGQLAAGTCLTVFAISAACGLAFLAIAAYAALEGIAP